MNENNNIAEKENNDGKIVSDSRAMLDEFIAQRRWNSSKLLGLSECADFAHWYLQENIKSIITEGNNESGDLPLPFTRHFNSFLLVNALRNLTKEQRHNLTISLIERDEELQNAIGSIKKAFEY